MSRFKDLQKNLFGGTTSNARQFGMIFTLVGIVLLFQIWTNGLTLSSTNLIIMVQQYSYILILAIGMLMVIVAGHIDLSVGSIAAFVGIIVAKVMADYDLPWPLAILVGLAIGVIVGAWQGFWVAYVGVPAFIVTLAGMLLFRGGNQYIGNADTVPVPQGFRQIGAGFLPEVGPATGYNNLTLLLGLAACVAVVLRELKLRKTRTEMDAENAPMWVSAIRVGILVAAIIFVTLRFAGGRIGTSFPISGIILAVLVLAYSFITRNTAGGRHIYAVGGNARAAELSGVKLQRVNFMVMMNMSILAALAGMIFVARSAASGPQDGLSWELDAIAACFIGGAAVSGGLGTISGAIVGGLVMAVLNNGLQLKGVGSDMVQIIKGLVLLLAVALDVYNKAQGRFSIIGTLTRSFRGGGTPASPEPTQQSGREPVKTPVA
ncbi:multiple monosaccharide ABC transporter permease [Spirilliplanes yamanashiensis]|uniref:Xylose transport system permease protein XylH n=1 Tax=Spirilliplanes yamanashiensis TaxID=42233 RepID=A0A8J3Y5E6_9ACTN|nr:multiple monosaccharide ABC transporter permease [Spirilliplanes yamanashiensis]MDP9819372.1 putative multiple sugar transport system permease protein [Spirilliplanes yamanashiensis]GIJ01804.1 ABC transporter permease [Spirilliplanes yamanashiensis]